MPQTPTAKHKQAVPLTVAADRPASLSTNQRILNRRDVDLHVHTVTSSCGFTTHRRILDLARAAGRGVVAVTDHDTAEGALAVRELAAQTGDDVLVLVGMELTTSDFGHVVLFGRGVEDDWGWVRHSPFPRHIPEHWVAIQAHPFRGKVVVHNGALEAPPLPDLPERIDAVEVWNGGDLVKKTPHLRDDLNTLSWDYVRHQGKIAVASSDGHRPIWVHSFFTRFARPIEHVDDLVEQIRNGDVSPQAQDQSHVDRCIDGWRRREVVEWHEAGKDWRALAEAAGHDLEYAAESIRTFQEIRALHERGATLAQIGEATCLSSAHVADYLDIVEEEHHSARKRLARRLPFSKGEG
ncbi:MAG: hypothetical protein HY332_19955 [Chloroflexi bacterium]|nr:hypothetical protein [Chloroflexota bacterium]